MMMFKIIELKLQVLKENANCNFKGIDSLLLMSETAKLRNLITEG